MAELLLVRHGELELNKPEKFWGRSDISLSANGVRQAGLLRKRLAEKRILAAYCSSLSRARQTAEVIMASHGIEVRVCPELDEINFGQFEGMTFDQIKAADPETARRLMVWDIKPGFPGGESIQDLDQRVKSFIDGHDLTGKGTILVVAHAGTLRLLICNLLGLAMDQWRKLRLNLGSLSIVHTYPELNILTTMNDICHLKDSSSGLSG